MTSTLFKRCVAFALTFALIVTNAYVAPATSDAAAKVSLNKKSVSLTVAQNGEKITRGTATLKIKKSKKIKIKKTTYKVADTDVATVNKSGKITAKSTGTTKVNVTVNYKLKKKSYKKTLKCDVNVRNTYKNVLSDIKLNYPNYATYVGEVTGIKPAYISSVKLNDDFYLYDCLKIKIEDTSIAKLGEAGFIMGLKEGSTRITVTTTDGSDISKTANLKVYKTAEDVPETEDTYQYEFNKKWQELNSQWTNEDKVRYTDENGVIRWSYTTEAEMLYNEKLEKLIETYKTAGKQEDNTSKDVLQSAFSTSAAMYTKEGEAAFYKDIKQQLIDPVLKAKSVDELIKLAADYSHNGINSIIESSVTYYHYINNMAEAKEIELKNAEVPDKELDTSNYYYPYVTPATLYQDDYAGEKVDKYLKEYVSSVFSLLNIDDSAMADATVKAITNMPEIDAGSLSTPSSITLDEFKTKYPHLYIVLEGNEYDINGSTPIYIEYDSIFDKLEELMSSEDNLTALKGYTLIAMCNPILNYGLEGRRLNFKLLLRDDYNDKTPVEFENEVKDQLDGAFNGLETDIAYDIDHVYTETYYSKTYKSDLEQLVKLYIDQYKDAISSSDMEASTKEKLLDKANAMKFSSLYPTEEEYKDLCVSDDLKNADEGGRFLDTLLAIRKNHQHLTRKTINHNVKDMTWWAPTKNLLGGVKPWDMNGFHDYYFNQVYLCHPILANSFFDNPDNSKEIDIMNIGYMAGTIGHEIGHAFDDVGCRFNSKGNIENLWSSRDKAIYKSKVDKLANIYETTFAGCDYNKNIAYYQKGYDVVNETMADLGGFEIGIGIIKKKYPDDDESLKKYYSYYVQQWLSTEDDHMDDYRLEWRFDDPHPIYKNRTNPIISMTDDFYRIYNIKESDAMYIAPEDRVTLWN